MRLIDADALKKDIADLVVGGEKRIYEAYEGNEWIHGIHSAYREIDNAPTVCNDNYAMGYQDGVKKVLSERPHGEYIPIYKEDSHKAYWDNIGKVDMREEAENEQK